MSDNTTYYSPGGGRLLLDRDLTNEEREEYMRYFASKGLCVLPEDIVVEDGVITIKKRYEEKIE